MNPARRRSQLPVFDSQQPSQKPGAYIAAAVVGFFFCIIVFPALFVYEPRIGVDPFEKELKIDIGPPPTSFRILAVTDLDSRSRVDEDGKYYHAILQEGTLDWSELDSSYNVHWGRSVSVKSGHNESGRGMELSELVLFNDHLYTIDDRSGILFEVMKLEDGSYNLVPQQILMEGNGMADKGMKAEWATVKDNKLMIGSIGKEYSNDEGTIISTSNNWIATFDERWNINRHDWTDNYQLMRKATGTNYPGYMIHEAANWSSHLKRWVFMPRRVSSEPYNDTRDEKKGSNKILLVSEDFNQVEVKSIGAVTPERGFSSFKFLPGSKDSVIVALKSEENDKADSQNSYITVFDLNGKVLLDETEVPGKFKFEGLAIWPLLFVPINVARIFLKKELIAASFNCVSSGSLSSIAATYERRTHSAPAAPTAGEIILDFSTDVYAGLPSGVVIHE